MTQKLERGRIVKVSPSLVLGVPINEPILQGVDPSKLYAINEIEEEKRIKALEDLRRYNIYKHILFSKYDSDWRYHHVLYGLISIVASNLLCGVITVIPMHNLILNPLYWYETPIQVSVGYFLSYAAYMILNCSYWMNTDEIKTAKKFGTFYVFILLLVWPIVIIGRLVWSDYLELRYPIPFIGMIVVYLVIPISFIGLWYLFPKNWRKNNEIWKRFIFFAWAILANLFITLLYSFYQKAFTSVPEKWQWGAALFLIPVREFSLWLQRKVAGKAAGAKSSAVEITCGHNINTRHCFFLSVILGTTATDVTCWMILAIDFSIDMLLMIKVIRMIRKGVHETNESSMVYTFMELIMNETVEIVVPFTYLSCFMVAYIGPNSGLLGGVLCEMWHFTAVNDLGLFLENVGVFLLADCICVTTTAICMWLFAGVNFIRALSSMQKEFWLLMAVNTAYTVNMVSFL